MVAVVVTAADGTEYGWSGDRLQQKHLHGLLFQMDIVGMCTSELFWLLGCLSRNTSISADNAEVYASICRHCRRYVHGRTPLILRGNQ